MTATSTETHDAKTEPEIHLFVPQTESSDSVIPVRWCLCKTLFDDLKSNEAMNPYLLLVVASPDGKEVERKLLPLEQTMEYISFRRPGKHLLFAAVVWHYDGDVKALKNQFINKDEYGHYAYGVLRGGYSETPLRLRDFNGIACCQRGPRDPVLTVDVSSEFFAKPHSKLLNRWVNFWFENKHPADQCQFRRRCILAFTFQPIAMFFYTIGLFLARLVIAAFLLSLGKRKIKLAPVVRLFKYRTNDIWWENKTQHLGSVFTTTKQGEKKPVFWRCFTPIYFLIVAGVVVSFEYLLAYAVKDYEFSLTRVSVIILGICFGLFAGLYILFLLNLLIDLLIKKIQKTAVSGKDEKQRREKELVDLRAERLRQEALERFDTDFQELVCPGVPLEPSLAALPPRRRTIHLQFLNLKAKVCKPFAR